MDIHKNAPLTPKGREAIVRSGVEGCAKAETLMRLCAPVSAGSVFKLVQHDDCARRYRRMWRQAGECRIRPIGEAHDFTRLTVGLGNIARFQHLETAVIEKESVVPEHIGQLRHSWMAIGNNLGIHLIQGLLHLCRIQLHGSLLLRVEARSRWAVPRCPLLKNRISRIVERRKSSENGM